MKRKRSIHTNLGLRAAVRLTLIAGAALLLLAVFLWGLAGIPLAYANPGDLYVDDATGQDVGGCGTVDTPCKTISYTIHSRAAGGDTLLIAAGTYMENLTISGITLTLRGGYALSDTITGTVWLPGATETIIDGNTAGRTILIHDSNSVLENLTITGGDTPDQQCWGGGVWVTNGNVTIRGSTITNNWADCSGGGIEVNSDWGPAHLTLEDSIIVGNYSTNQGGGISVWHTSAALTNVLVIDNTGDDDGSGLRIEDGDVLIQNSTIADNQGGGSAINVYDTFGSIETVVIRNSIVWGNLSQDLTCSSDCDITNSDIGGGWPGTGNIDANPQFVDPANGDYHLQAWSPAIDNGAAAGAPDHDLDGVSRPQNAGFDMGVYEFVGTPIINQGTRYVAMEGTDAGPNLCLDNALPCQTINHALAMANPGESILVAQGVYTENLSIAKPITLSGGDSYDSVGSIWLPGNGETIIDGSGSQTVVGDWDGRRVRKSAVISDSGEYKMWYGGGNLLSEVQIGLATSSDGISWTRYFDNPVLTGTLGTWNQPRGENVPFVIKENGLYKMWYEGSNENMVRQLGYATSANGIDWTEYAGNPVLTAGPETYDQEAAAHGSLLNDGGTYKLWYFANGDQGAIIAYATSPDGVNWTKQGPALLPESGGWDESAVWGTSVLKLDGLYWMWYGGAGPQHQPAIGVVTSTDGINWTRFLAEPVLTETVPIGDPHVISDGGVLKMWYTDYEQGVINYAESNDGIAWTTSVSNPVLTPGTPGQWGGPVARFESGSDGSTLDGFTITGGDAENGGGVYIQGVSVRIANAIVAGNVVNHGGGGIMADDYAQAQIVNVVVEHNSADYGGGIAVRIGSSAFINGGRVISNTAHESGGGVGIWYDSPVVVMANTVISDNYSRHAGGIAMWEPGGVFTGANLLIVGNHSGLGPAGIALWGSNGGRLMNVTVANNDSATGFDGAEIEGPASGFPVVNSIFWGNGDGDANLAGSNLSVSFSDVGGGEPGPGNIDADPQFVDPNNGDHHLQGSSPAIDAGTPAGAPPADLDGVPRDAIPDMGAFEYIRFAHDVAVVNVLPAGNVAVNVPFPVRATLYNVGEFSETNVPVTCAIEYGGGPVYAETLNSLPIPPLNWQVLEFPAYTPANQGIYSLVCQSRLPNDGRPENDVFTRTLNALEEIADVWTKDNPDDDGEVPSGLNNWYMSPDLWVRNDDDGGLIHQPPIAGITNTVYVRLRNRGTVAVSGTVDVSWIEPTLGARCGDWAPIDTVAFTNLLPGEARIVSAPWKPTRTGHTCLQDVIDSPQDPYNRGLECAPQWIPWDNNVEWRNVEIIENPAGGLRGMLDIKQAEVQLVNVYNLPQDVDLIIERMTFPTTGTITVQLPAELFDRWLAYSGHWSEGVEVLTGTKAFSVTGAVSATIGAIPMEAAEKGAIGLRFEGPAGLEFELAVRERIDGLTVGGMAYQWRIPDTTPPNVISVFPTGGATKVALDAPLVINFDEEIGPLNFNLNLSSGDPGGWQMSWNDAGTVVTATHAGFAAGSAYTATVTASDAAANPMATPYQWNFTTQTAGYEIYLPLILKNHA